MVRYFEAGGNPILQTDGWTETSMPIPTRRTILP